MEERIQKILSRAGYGSRRACEELITKGRVTVNGETAIIGGKADPVRDHISVDGSLITKAEALTYIALNKPRGVLSTVEAPDPRTTVRDLVPLPGTLYPVGRLDVESEGLILLTNDGDLANRLTHPRYGHEKEYRVLVARQPDHQQIDAWLHGVVLEDGYRTSPAKVTIESKFGKGAWLRVILKEGRKRQIREMGMRTGLPVVRIIRVRIGSLLLGLLKSGDWRPLSPHEVVDLKNPSAGEARKRVSSRSSALQKIHPAGQRQTGKRSPQKPAGDRKPSGRRPAGPGQSQRAGKSRSGDPAKPKSSPSGERKPASKRPPRRTPR